MSYKGTSFQKHTKDYSLVCQPINQPNMQGYIHSVAIHNIQNVKSSTINLTQEEALRLRDCMLKSYPLESYPLNQGE